MILPKSKLLPLPYCVTLILFYFLILNIICFFSNKVNWARAMYGSIKSSDHWFGWYGCGNEIKLWTGIPLYCCSSVVMKNSIESDGFSDQLPSHMGHTEPWEALLMYVNFTQSLWNITTERWIQLTPITEYSRKYNCNSVHSRKAKLLT